MDLGIKTFCRASAKMKVGKLNWEKQIEKKSVENCLSMAKI